MSGHLHLSAWLCHGAGSLSKALLQAQNPTLNALDYLFAGDVEVERDFGREEQRVAMATTSKFKVHNRLDHALVDDSEAPISPYRLIILWTVNRAAAQIKLEAEHVLGLARTANLSHLIAHRQLSKLGWRHGAHVVAILCLRHKLEARATLL